MRSPLVSIIVPVFNEENYLEDCLSSISAQTYKNLEIICIDDGSTDKSLEIMQKMRQNDSRIKIICQSNSFAGVARNKGLKIASGEYYMFLDSDDLFSPNLVSELVKKSLETNADIVLCSGYSMNNSTKDTYKMPEVGATNNLFPNKKIFSPLDVDGLFQMSVTWAWDKMYKADFIKNNNLYFQNTKVCNDLVFVCMAYVLSKKITCVNEFLICHRTNVPSSLYNASEYNWQCLFKSLFLLKDKLLEHDVFSTYEQSYINLAAENIVYYLLMRFSSSSYFNAFYDYYKEYLSTYFNFKMYASDFYRDKFVYKIITFLENNDKISFLLQTISVLNIKCSKILGDLNSQKRHFPLSIIQTYSSVVIYGDDDLAILYYDEICKTVPNMSVNLIKEHKECETSDKLKKSDLILITNNDYDIYKEIKYTLNMIGIADNKIKWVNTMCADSWLLKYVNDCSEVDSVK